MSAALVPIAGYAFVVLVSAGSEVRGRVIADRCKSALAFAAASLDAKPPIRLLVLSEEDWKQHAGYPVYGMPHFTGNDTLVVAASAAPFWRATMPSAPETLPALKAAYGETLDPRPFFDLLVVHELAHVIQTHAARVMPRRWLNELFCNVFLHAYVAEKEPAILPALEALPRARVSLGSGSLEHTTLAAFDSVYTRMPPSNYAWYQTQLHVAAKRIYDSAGTAAVRDLWRLGGQKTSESETVLGQLHETQAALARIIEDWPLRDQKQYRAPTDTGLRNTK